MSLLNTALFLKKPGWYVTYKDPCIDCGMGDRMKNLVSALVLAEMQGWTYIHSKNSIDNILPLNRIFHRNSRFIKWSNVQTLSEHWFHIPTSLFESQEALENYSTKFSTFPHYVKGSGVPFEELNKILDGFSLHPSKKGLVELTDRFRIQLEQVHRWQKQGLIKRDIYTRVVGLLREAILTSREFRRIESNTVLTEKIVVRMHIRRGDVADSEEKRPDPGTGLKRYQFQQMTMPIEYYDGVLRGLYEKYGKENLSVELYTNTDWFGDSVAKDVINYGESEGLKVHVARDRSLANFRTDFYRFCTADILVVSNSDMSQMAGIINKGLKIYIPSVQYFEMPKAEFIRSNEKGSLIDSLPASSWFNINRKD